MHQVGDFIAATGLHALAQITGCNAVGGCYGLRQWPGDAAAVAHTHRQARSKYQQANAQTEPACLLGHVLGLRGQCCAVAGDLLGGLLQQGAGFAVNTAHVRIASARVIAIVFKLAQAFAVGLAHVLVGLLKLLHQRARGARLQARQQLLAVGLNIALLLFKRLPVTCTVLRSVATQQHVFPFLRLYLELLEQQAGDTLVPHVAGNVFVIERERLLLAQQSKKCCTQHQQQGCSHKERELKAEFHRERERMARSTWLLGKGTACKAQGRDLAEFAVLRVRQG